MVSGSTAVRHTVRHVISCTSSNHISHYRDFLPLFVLH